MSFLFMSRFVLVKIICAGNRSSTKNVKQGNLVLDALKEVDGKLRNQKKKHRSGYNLD